jgi:hypothetical protein
MADQSRGLRYSVSTISAIERGNRPIPPNYPEEVARWLNLSPNETRELVEFANGERSVIYVSPADEERAQLAFDFARTLNDLPIDQVRQLRKRLTSSAPGTHTLQELQQMAALLRECFALGSKLAFDLLDVLENKLPLIEPNYSLQVDNIHSVGDRVAAYSEALDSVRQRIVFSEHTYEELHKQRAEVRVVAAHELSHWLVHPKSHTFANARRTVFQAAEVEADRLAREILLPTSLVRQFETVGQLAMTCNVPIAFARFRMKELGLGPFRGERGRVEAKLRELSAQLSLSKRETGTVVHLPTPSSTDKATTDRSSKQEREPLDAKNMLVALGSYSGHHQPFYDKSHDTKPPQPSAPGSRSNSSLEWYQEFGWR